MSTRPDRERLPQLNDVLVKACANDPNKRYGSAAGNHRDLTALKKGERLQNRAQNFAGDDIARDSSGRRNRILAKDVTVRR